MVSSLFVFPIVYTLLRLTEMDENPVPTEARQSTFGPSAGHTAVTFSDDMPSRLSPRHWGQSAAGNVAVKSEVAAIKFSFISSFYHDRRTPYRQQFSNHKFLRSPRPFAARLWR
jgi:hypothetical protein